MVKRYKPEGDIALLSQLCRYFRLDPRDLTHTQRVEMLYIYKRLAEQLNDADIQRIINEVDRIRITLKIRGRRRCLYYVFYYCQSKHMQENGNYDTDTWQPPVQPIIDIYY